MSLSFMAMCLVIAITVLGQWRLSRDARAARRADGLTLTDLQEFRFSYANPRSRQDMPQKFARFAAATDGTRARHILACLIIVAAIFSFIYIGPWP